MPITEGDAVTIEYIGRLDDGTVFDTSLRTVAEESGLLAENPNLQFQPLTIEIGDDRTIPGIRGALLGLEVEDTTTIVVPPAEAFGEPSREKIGSYDREAFENLIGTREYEEGFEVESKDGLDGRVVDIGPDEVTVDFNHELAGKRLTFEIEIVDVADSSEAVGDAEDASEAVGDAENASEAGGEGVDTAGEVSNSTEVTGDIGADEDEHVEGQ